MPEGSRCRGPAGRRRAPLELAAAADTFWSSPS